ncbi:hypothetical protein [Tepidibacter thalassicus]|uniref:Uncharacterized protein n=1 Tax=Tepidibacter thalassicus DSM 15285 TaxID=1123350 RepID=A0A1M5STI8_9FIRM|nr:hypothetical protein [Tepidibacter thalassicus]SHH41861.1 hypothetical protein SAMN02744040_01898 [Tepidibacter thalassicus DSM 15285]
MSLNNKLLIYSEKLDEKYILNLFKNLQNEFLVRNFGTKEIEEISEDKINEKAIEIYLDILDFKEKFYCDVKHGFYINGERLSKAIKHIQNLGFNAELYKSHSHLYCDINSISFEGYCYFLSDGTYRVFYTECNNSEINKKCMEKLKLTTENNKYLKIEKEKINWDELCYEFEKWILQILENIE